MNRYIKQNLIFFILINSGNVFNYLFQVMVGRKLNPEDYGAFNALNSLMILVTILAGILPMVIAKFTVRFSLEGMEKVRGLFHGGLRWLSITGSVAFILGLMAIPLVKGFLQIDNTWAIVLMMGQIAVTFLLPLPMGILQGLERFVPYGSTSAMTTGGRFFSGILFVLMLHWGMSGAVLSGLTGSSMSLILGLFFLKDVISGQRQVVSMGLAGEMLRYSVPVLLMSVGMGSLGNIDMVLVRHFCQPHDAGYYATAAILGRIAFFLPGILLMVLFPSAAKAHSLGTKNLRALWWSVGLTGILAGGFAGFCAVWPEWIITLLYGTGYLPSVPIFRIISAAMAFLAMANVFFTYSLAQNRFGFLWFLGLGMAVLLGGVWLFHDYSIQIAWVLLVSSAAMCGSTILWFWFIEMQGAAKGACL